MDWQAISILLERSRNHSSRALKRQILMLSEAKIKRLGVRRHQIPRASTITGRRLRLVVCPTDVSARVATDKFTAWS